MKLLQSLVSLSSEALEKHVMSLGACRGQQQRDTCLSRSIQWIRQRWKVPFISSMLCFSLLLPGRFYLGWRRVRPLLALVDCLCWARKDMAWLGETSRSLDIFWCRVRPWEKESQESGVGVKHNAERENTICRTYILKLLLHWRRRLWFTSYFQLSVSGSSSDLFHYFMFSLHPLQLSVLDHPLSLGLF